MAILGVDLGGTKALAVVLEGGAVVCRARRPTGRATGPRAAVALVTDVVEEVTRLGHRVDRVGVGFPGVVDGESGSVRTSPILDGWSDVPFAAELRLSLHRPCRVDNDVNNAAAAEHLVRMGRALSGAPTDLARTDTTPADTAPTSGERAGDDMLYVAAGTGIGAALVLGGTLWRGGSGGAGELGHMVVSAGDAVTASTRCDCGRRGCLHLYASGRSIEAGLGLEPGTLGDAVTRHDAGGDRARVGLESAAGVLGRAIADAMSLLDLPLVAVGGGLAEHPGFVEAVARSFVASAMATVADACRVEAALAGYEAGAIGSALLVEDTGPR